MCECVSKGKLSFNFKVFNFLLANYVVMCLMIRAAFNLKDFNFDMAVAIENYVYRLIFFNKSV